MEIKGKAIVLTNGVYNTKSAKTAHGLVRGSSRFDILGIIDNKFYDNDAGKLLDGKYRNIQKIYHRSIIIRNRILF